MSVHATFSPPIRTTLSDLKASAGVVGHERAKQRRHHIGDCYAFGLHPAANGAQPDRLDLEKMQRGAGQKGGENLAAAGDRGRPGQGQDNVFRIDMAGVDILLDPPQQAALAVDDAFGAAGAARGIEHDGGRIDGDDIGQCAMRASANVVAATLAATSIHWTSCGNPAWRTLPAPMTAESRAADRNLRNPRTRISHVERNRRPSGRHARQHRHRVPDRVGEKNPDRLSVGNGGGDPAGQVFNRREKLGVSQSIGAITDRELVGILLSNVPQMVENSNAREIGTHPPIRANRRTIHIQSVIGDL